MNMYGSAIVLALAFLSVIACRFLQKKRNTVPQIYDVFLSFKGQDTRTGFTDFLYNSLKNAGVHVFRDNDELPFGEDIDQELLQAIKTCRIAIPIISEKYSHSKWCLRELTKIMECHREHGKSVFPVFYKVDVVDVGGPRGNFEEALRGHEMQFSPEEVQEWGEALTSVARIRGWISQTIADGHEADLVEMVREKVLSELKTMRIEKLPMFIRSVYLYFSEKSKWQVFLAFSGDVQNGLAAHLYAGLVAARIKVFRHDDPSLIGKDIAGTFWNAIEHCPIYIPILSQNFASSSWCVKGLTQMVECNRTKGKKILPIFYQVSPSQVRGVLHSFRNDMLQHEDLEGRITSERWKRALRVVGASRGWDSKEIANGNEAELVRRVVKEVSRLLKNPKTHDPIPIR